MLRCLCWHTQLTNNFCFQGPFRTRGCTDLAEVIISQNMIARMPKQHFGLFEIKCTQTLNMILIHLVWSFQGERIESQIQLFILEEWLYILANKSLDHMLAHSQLAIGRDTPGTAGGPGGRDRTLDVKSRKKIT